MWICICSFKILFARACASVCVCVLWRVRSMASRRSRGVNDFFSPLSILINRTKLESRVRVLLNATICHLLLSASMLNISSNSLANQSASSPTVNFLASTSSSSIFLFRLPTIIKWSCASDSNSVSKLKQLTVECLPIICVQKFNEKSF